MTPDSAADFSPSNDTSVDVIVRPASRILLLDSQDRILLMLFAPGQEGRGVWITPGGGLEPGESHADAAIRELWEETGLRVLELGPCVWHRVHRFNFAGRVTEQRERFYVCRVDTFDLGDHLNLDEKERDEITEVRWWTLDEIEAASGQHFGPGDLARLLRPILAGDIPAQPVLVGR
jgi:8-oxo-dGTP pyrophosphatase MutT (NUDIX family)